jgi:hypothetical protein
MNKNETYIFIKEEKSSYCNLYRSADRYNKQIN